MGPSNGVHEKQQHLETTRNPLELMEFESFDQFREMTRQRGVVSLIANKDEEGNNMLHLASMSGKLDFVKYLLEKGFNINSRNVREILGRKPVQLRCIWLCVMVARMWPTS